MQDTKTEEAIRKYMEGASEREQREFAEAFLDSRKRAREKEYGEIPHRVVVWSRILSVVAIAYGVYDALSIEHDAFELLDILPGAAFAWYPNFLGDTSIRILGRGYFTQRVTPWAALVLGWVILLLPVSFRLLNL